MTTGRINLPYGYHISELDEGLRQRGGLTETNATRANTRQRCKKCGTPLSSFNPYNFCNLCIAKAESALYEAGWVGAKKSSESMHDGDRETIRMKALRRLGSTKLRKLTKKTKVRLMLRDRIGGERTTPDQWAWGDTA